MVQQGNVMTDVGFVNEEEFRGLIEKRAQTLLVLTECLSKCPAPREALTRPLLGDLLSHSMQLEEILDTYDASKSCNWCSLRSVTATLKLFSDVSYELLHIRHRVPKYHLLPVERDFVAATNEALEFAGLILARAAREMQNQAPELGLSCAHQQSVGDRFEESLPKGRLAHDCEARQVDTVAETVALLATAFLNLASECEDVRATSRAQAQERALGSSPALTEERLRSLEFQFHNLQSQYDTYVSGTKVEHQDTDLPVLRGHVSVVFHLLRAATLFAHYFERHVNKQCCTTMSFAGHMVEPDALSLVLINYSITFIDLYTSRAVSLCQEMLKRYAEAGQIEVPIPKYRGFHVRPSTLIAKLVLHYGSKVQMLLGDEVYDAGSSLDLFRANEKINAQKRRWLAKEIVRLELVPDHCDAADWTALVRSVVLALAEKSKLILYEQPLELPERTCAGEGTPLERVTDETGRLLAMGKIDIGIDMTATFIGDKRVLGDIRLLAEHGYGEDNFGNNVPLPKKLAYLRR
ncbi:MAG: hypothetical protein A2Y76_15945 [Planctomycetes bacterium RBG_13_60_9]|nr:MAG: hypothetical protein A2Y76_15945 [Planctomycetes bacterium RBG_13_60_9]